jgi:predicted ATPase
LIPQIDNDISEKQKWRNILSESKEENIPVHYLQKVVIIEEPENSLHPAFQSMLAEMFVEAIKKFNIQLIIETHSEYLIRKLQYLTASTKSDLNSDDTVIYYFYHPDKIPPGEKQVKKINMQKDGRLTDDFGSGFFDEADNIALELFLLKESQHN